MSAQKKYQPEVGPGFSTLPAGTSANALATGPEQFVAVNLSAAQLQAMNGAPVPILPAPGAGKAYVVLSVGFEVNRTATAFTGGGAITLQYHTTTASVPHTGAVPAAALTTAGAGQTLTQLGPNTGANGLAVPVNEGIDITNATAAFATGTGTAKVFIAYRTVSL